MELAKKFKGVGAKAFDKLGPTGLKIKAHSPEIKLAIGVGMIVFGTVRSCVATLKIEEILDEREKTLEEVHAAADDIADDETFEYTEADLKRDVAIVNFKSWVCLGRAYAPGVVALAAGVMLVVSSHMEMRQRLAAATALYSIMEDCFSRYRERVQGEIGEERELELLYGLQKEEIEEVQVLKNGKEKKVKRTIESYSLEGLSPYARFWDAYNAPNRFNRSKTANRDFLIMALNACQDRFDRTGHLFLYEAYEALGLTYDGPITEGLAHTIGWVKGMGDDLIDFGYFLPINKEAWNSGEYGDNAKERSLILDFNVDGIVTDYI